MAQPSSPGLLAGLSSELSALVARIAPSVARVDDGSRLTATGFVWSADGVIVTTSHGTERDEDLSIELTEGTRHAATLVGREPETDIAVLRVEATGLPAIQTAGVEDARVGELALALGRPGSANVMATLGLIIARRESETNGQPGYVLSTDAALYPGFSGGPLVDMQGRVIGLTNRMFGRGAGVAVGAPIVAQVVQTLLTHGQVKRGYLGVRTQLVGLPGPLVQPLGVTQERGLLVVEVESGSPAEQAGLLLGDTLLTINAQALEDVDTLRRHLIAGQSITIQILRGGTLQTVTVALREA